VSAWAAFHKVTLNKEWQKRVAFHEAGHAVIANALGVKLDHATIRPKSFATAGYVAPEVFQKTFSPEDIIWSFAGAIAEEKFSGERCERSDTDNWHIRYHLGMMPRREKRKLVRAELKARAIQLVEDHWEAIIDVANELLRKGTMTGERIAVIVSRVGDPNPCL
jgi:ATP-dependent Zn protease